MLTLLSWLFGEPRSRVELGIACVVVVALVLFSVFLAIGLAYVELMSWILVALFMQASGA